MPDTESDQQQLEWLIGEEESLSNLQHRMKERLKSRPIDYNSLSPSEKQVALFLKDRGEATIQVNQQERLTVAARKPSRLIYLLSGGLLS